MRLGVGDVGVWESSRGKGCRAQVVEKGLSQPHFWAFLRGPLMPGGWEFSCQECGTANLGIKSSQVRFQPTLENLKSSTLMCVGRMMHDRAAPFLASRDRDLSLALVVLVGMISCNSRTIQTLYHTRDKCQKFYQMCLLSFYPFKRTVAPQKLTQSPHNFQATKIPFNCPSF